NTRKYKTEYGSPGMCAVPDIICITFIHIEAVTQKEDPEDPPGNSPGNKKKMDFLRRKQQDKTKKYCIYSTAGPHRSIGRVILILKIFNYRSAVNRTGIQKNVKQGREFSEIQFIPQLNG